MKEIKEYTERDYLIEKVYAAINTTENLKSRIFEGNKIWAGERPSDLSNIINRLIEYLDILEGETQNATI